MTTFISYDGFVHLLHEHSGLLVVAMVSKCDHEARSFGQELEARVGGRASVRLMCAPIDDAPTLVFYEGGDPRVLLSRSGTEVIGSVSALLDEAARMAAMRPTVAEEMAPREQAALEETARMLAEEKLDSFPSFFQMARGLARDAWHAARQTAGGAPLLLPAETAAARLETCRRCSSFRDDRCVECGCFMSIKAHITAMRCPLDKWT